MRGGIFVGIIICLLLAGGAGSAVVPEAVPDLPVLGAPPIRGGGLIATPAAPVTPTSKTVDGQIDDWTGAPTRLGGTAVYSAGEYVYQDFLMDNWGADDGEDAQRFAVTGPLSGAEPRTHRSEALAQALGEQFDAPEDVPETIATQARYGDIDETCPSCARNEADIEEVRVASDGTTLFLLVRTNGMTTSSGTAVLVLLDTQDGGSAFAGLSSAADAGFVAAGNGCVPSPCPAGVVVASNPSDFINAVEIGLPLPATMRRVGLVAGVMSGAAFVPVNVAFRFSEPIAIWMERQQAFDLLAGDVDEYLVPVDPSKLQAGYTETFEPRPGYYERIYVSDSPVVREQESGSYFQGVFQHYGLYLPSSWRPGVTLPATFWTHYRGGHAHDAGAWVPGLIRQLGEARQNIIVSPGARGTSTWYVGRGHEDVLEVWDDVMSHYSIDPDRVYVSGYSMGGFASYLLGLVYPDRFAAAFPTAGPITQGGWFGAGPPVEAQNGGDLAAEFMFDVLENARNLPYVIYQGGVDYLVNIGGTTRVASRLDELGYRHRYYVFPAAEHYTMAVIDEWTEAARYLDQFRRDPNPPRVTYRVKPALERAVETISVPSGASLDYAFDGAYWVDGLTVRDGSPTDPATLGTIDATTLGRGMKQVLDAPEAGTGGQLWPYAMAGLRWVENGYVPPENRFTATLTNLATATLDVARMGLGTAQRITATVATDGATTLRLAGHWAAAPAVSGKPPVSASYDSVANVLTIMIGASGTYEILIDP